MTEVLRAENVHVTFRGGTTRAVDGVHLRIHKGEIIAIVGESGCGKSTLSRALLGLVPTTAGTVQFEGSPLPTASAALKALSLIHI